jgi:hypothetical protein
MARWRCGLLLAAVCAVSGCGSSHSAVVDGVTLTLPASWTVLAPTNPKHLLEARRSVGPLFRSGGSLWVQESAEAKGRWTTETAGKWQRNTSGFDRFFMHQPASNLSLEGGAHTSICVESALISRHPTLNCAVLGTPLVVAYVGSGTGESDVRNILHGLK